jgi:hypothetical protein
MFFTHKGHEVTEPDEAVRNLRDQFDKNIKSGIYNTSTINELNV